MQHRLVVIAISNNAATALKFPSFFCNQKMDKKPISRSAKTGRAVLNSTFSGRAASAAIPQTAAKDVRRKVGSRGMNQSISEQTFAAPPPTPSVAERDCEVKLEYNKLLQSIFMECTLEETAEREKTELDVMLTQLAERCERNVQLLDKTHKRLNEISFLSEKQRILEMKDDDCSKFFDHMDTSKAEKILADLTTKQQSYLDRIETKNVDLGYSLQSGHQQLLDAMEDVLRGFDNIKNQSKMSLENLDELSEVNRSCGKIETQMKDLNELKREFSAKFPSLSEQALIQSSEELARSVGEQLSLNESVEE